MGLGFEWNPNKAAVNHQKHGVTFEEAATVFSDSLGATFPDPDHSDDEDRFLTIGMSNRSRLLIVSHMERNDLIRVISARQLTHHERRQYETAGI